MSAPLPPRGSRVEVPARPRATLTNDTDVTITLVLTHLKERQGTASLVLFDPARPERSERPLGINLLEPLSFEKLDIPPHRSAEFSLVRWDSEVPNLGYTVVLPARGLAPAATVDIVHIVGDQISLLNRSGAMTHGGFLFRQESLKDLLVTFALTPSPGHRRESALSNHAYSSAWAAPAPAEDACGGCLGCVIL
jgi:hypothetical protein